jgi:hypothetical protein
MNTCWLSCSPRRAGAFRPGARTVDEGEVLVAGHLAVRIDRREDDLVALGMAEIPDDVGLAMDEAVGV